MSRITAVLAALVAFATTVHAAQHIYHKGLCDLDYCKCKEAIHPAWITINCSVNGTTLNVGHMDLPPSTTELEIRGSDYVSFGAGAFNSVKDLRRVSITRSGNIYFRPMAAVELNVLNLSLEVQHCKLLQFDKRAFISIKGPLSVIVDDCEAVDVQGETFSWLLNFKVSKIKELTLKSGSFSLDTSATTVGQHGFGLTIEIINSTVPEFSRGTFGSSAGRLHFEGIITSTIRSGAFSANTYNLIEIIRSDIHTIEENAFSGNSFIKILIFNRCKIKHVKTTALTSGIEKLNLNQTRFYMIDSGAVNTTVATITIFQSEFHKFAQRSFELSSWNLLQMENNSFDEMPPNSIAASGVHNHKLIFKNNEIETVHPQSLSFIGNAAIDGDVEYENNYYGISCGCNATRWLATTMGLNEGYQYENESHCTVDDFFARCFNVPEQNVLYSQFMKEVCHKEPTLHCQSHVTNEDGDLIEFKNPRFPHKVPEDDIELSERNKKVIGIVLVSCFGCIIIALLFSLIRWWRKKRGNGQCTLKTIIISSTTECGSFCSRLCSCGSNGGGIANAGSISQLSINEYSERHHLNESRAQDLVQESSFREVVIVPTEDKFTQTLPEELTKELLDKLKERLDNPENYIEAREMIEHLYELTKMPVAGPTVGTENNSPDENIYELPYQEQDQISRNKNNMVSVGTRTPSLDKLLPLSPYHRQTALSHEYFEPKDLAVHLYAEIANSDKEKRTMLGAMPDVIAEQAIPRGPYLQAKLNSSSSSSSPAKSSSWSTDSPRYTSSIKSNTSNSSGKMLNRPLPEKPMLDPGEGTSSKHC